jgi:hypothetical protein
MKAYYCHQENKRKHAGRSLTSACNGKCKWWQKYGRYLLSGHVKEKMPKRG